MDDLKSGLMDHLWLRVMESQLPFTHLSAKYFFK